MKLTVDKDNQQIKLKVTTTDGGNKTICLPPEKLYYWYPFNLNFYYKYSNSRGYIYLSTDKSYKGPNYYNIDVLKRTKPLGERNGVPFHPFVYKRNRDIIQKARGLDLPTIKDTYTLDDVELGFSEVGIMINIIKSRAEDRLLERTGDNFIIPEMFSEEWDKKVYSSLTEKEQEVLIELGEMYSMLTVMRKLVS